METFLTDLDLLLTNRKEQKKSGSYTSSLFEAGTDRLLKKIGEEAGEVIIAAKNNDATELKNEAADLLFHLMIVLKDQNLSINDVIAVLKDRHNS
tara:strand:+ start:553 stop:837 length:285 start_codon:yes stop_codon:yes gene_type:complete